MSEEKTDSGNKEESVEYLGYNYTNRQLDILRGIIDPTNDEEYDWMQKHANDIIPPEKTKSLDDSNQPPTIDELPPPGIAPGELERADPKRVEAWQKATSPEDYNAREDNEK